jgi:hypothetical protein
MTVAPSLSSGPQYDLAEVQESLPATSCVRHATKELQKPALSPFHRIIVSPGHPPPAPTSVNPSLVAASDRELLVLTMIYSRADRRRPGRHPQRPGRPAIQIPDPRPGRRGHHRGPDPAGAGTAAQAKGCPPPRRTDARLHHAQPADRDPHRGSPRIALGPRRPGRRPGPPARCRRTWPCGGRSAPTARPRPSGPAAPSASPSWRSRRSAHCWKPRPPSGC